MNKTLKKLSFKCLINILLSILILLFFNVKANSFETAYKNLFEPIELLSSSKVVNYTFEDGLTSNYVYSISQDGLGYIWIATEAGLSRFNGNEFYNFTTKNGLKRNETVDLFRTKNERLWLASNGPLGYIENGAVHHLENDINVDLSWNYTVYEKNDSLWITYGKYFNIIDKNTNTVKSLNEKYALNYRKVILNSYNDHVFIYSNDTIYSFKNDKLLFNIAVNLSNSKSKRIMFANYKNGVFCIGKEQLFYFDFFTKKIRNYNTDVIDALRLKLFDDELIVLYSKGGLKSIHIKENMDLIEESKTNTDIIYTDAFRDKDLNFWLGTSTQGVFFLPKKSDQILSKSAIGNVKLSKLNCLLVDEDNTWIGTTKGELILINNGKAKVSTLPNKNPNGNTRINDILKLKSNKLLISSDAGLYFFDNNEFKYILYTALKKISLIGDDIYLNTFNSILKTNEACLTNMLNKPENIVSKNISFFDKKDSCFLGIYPNRSHQSLFISNKVFLYEPNTGLVSYKQINNELTDRKIIKENADIKDLYYFNNYVYVATIGEGILSYNVETEEIKTIKGLNSTIIHALDVDPIDSVMYAGSNAGIHFIKLNNAGFEDYVVAITQNDGLESGEIRDVIVTDTTIIAISDNGINYIDKNFRINKKLPNFGIEQFEVNNNQLPLRSTYKLKSTENNVTIKFNKIDFNNNTKTWFVYKKNDGVWKETRNNFLNFENQKQGNHKIHLGLVFSQNEIPQKIKELTFNIKPKFYKTIWAKFIAIVLALIIIFLIHDYLFSRRNLKALEKKVLKRTKQLNFKMQELDEANKNLKIKNRNLNSYTYLVSHDLKAPLYNISSFIKIIYEHNKKHFSDKDNEYHKHIKDSLQSMIDKINDLLTYSRVKSNVDLELVEPIILNEIINDVLKNFKFQIEKRNIQFKIEAKLPTIKIENTSAHLLFQNLISNSIKYNKSNKPTVEITSKQYDNEVTIKVKDNGIGIKKNYQTEAFDIFSRGHSNEAYEGTGIGLAICKKIVETHNGNITLESEEGKGSAFFLTFPK